MHHCNSNSPTRSLRMLAMRAEITAIGELVRWHIFFIILLVLHDERGFAVDSQSQGTGTEVAILARKASVPRASANNASF